MEAPKYFTEEQIELLDQLEQIADGNYSEDAMLAYVIEYTRWQDAEKKLSETGVIVGIKDKDGQITARESMYLKVAREAGRAARELRKELGI